MLLNPIALAKHCAQSGRFKDMQSVCHKVLAEPDTSLADLLAIGHLFYEFGFFTAARTCYERAQAMAPQDLRHCMSMAEVARDMGDHGEAGRMYARLLRQLPDHAAVRRNALISLEYDPDASDASRLAQARAWGQWATVRAGGQRARPLLSPLGNRPLRLGYVSSDLCQHTVGLFLKEVLKAHNKARVEVFAYSAGRVRDWVTDEMAAACTLRDVAALDDAALAERVRADGIDVLVDLSGHTAGSRLTAFAHRPAPVMVSWLGYFATTGLEYMDAVLLDDWHAPPGAELQFTEPIIRLAAGRFCYTPVSWAHHAVAPPPCQHKGYITFGCFNNTAKYNDGVLDLWGKVLQAVPGSRLVLKWRSYNDEDFCQQVRNAFAHRGIATERIELRGHSFHADLLQEYADIDIALDPFSFTGGLTSCESLWMGVPVVTWPQSRAVSRQTHALLHQIGLSEFSASDADDYVRKAVALAADPARLAQLRTTLRDRMRASSLMDTATYTRQLEDVLIGLYQKIEANVDSNPRKNAMTKVTIDNKQYDLDSLSNEAKAQLASIQFVDAELARLQAQAAALQTARAAYAKALQELLPKAPEGDTLKFS